MLARTRGAFFVQPRRLPYQQALISGRRKTTPYAEVLNIFDHGNYRLDSYNGFDPATGQPYLTFPRMFPILPSAGVTVDF